MARRAAPNGSRRNGQKGAVMKVSLNSKLVTLAVALVLVTSAFAASDAHKGTLQVFDPIQVNGKQLSAGEYQLRWEGNGPDVQLNILKGNKVLTTTQAKVVDLEQKANGDSAVVSKNTDGTRTLNQIRFGGKKYALSLNGETSQAEMNSSDSSK
jgi:hypothetical protein